MLMMATMANGNSTMSRRITSSENAAPNTVKKNRRSMYTATFVAVDAMKAVTAEGANV